MNNASKERTWDRVFKRNIEAAEENHTDVNTELEKEWPGGEKWVKHYVAPHIPENGTTIEIGAGSGRISQWVVPLAGVAYLTDYSNYACGILKEKFPSAIVKEVSDCKLDGIDDNSADIVYSISVFGHLFEEQVYTYFKQSFKKLKKGGKLAIHLTDMETDADHFVNAIPENVDTQRNIFRYMHPDYAKVLAKHAGFKNITTQKVDNTRAYFLWGEKV